MHRASKTIIRDGLPSSCLWLGLKWPKPGHQFHTSLAMLICSADRSPAEGKAHATMSQPRLDSQRSDSSDVQVPQFLERSKDAFSCTASRSAKVWHGHRRSPSRSDDQPDPGAAFAAEAA